MKRILSVVAAVALVLALSVTAFAADATPSITYDNKNEISSESTVTLDDGKTTAKVVVETTELTASEEADLEKAVADIKGATAAEVVEVKLVDENNKEVTSENFPKDGLKVVFARDDTTSEVVGVLCFNESTGEWESITDFQTGDNTVTVTFAHLCSVAFATKPVESSGTTTTTTTTNGGKKSPQTGNDTTVWTAAATVMVLAAVCCFVSARKKVTA